MYEIIKYIIKHCDGNTSYLTRPSTLIFQIDGLLISIKLDIELQEDAYMININSEIFEQLKDTKIEEFKIVLTEFLGDRDSLVKFDEIKEIYYHGPLPISITNSTQRLVCELNQLQKGLVLRYRLDVEDPSKGFCEVEGNFVGNIYLNNNYFSLEIIKGIISQLKSFEAIKVPPHYLVSYIKDKKPKNNFETQIINTNTKARRLGYLKLFASFINEKQKVPTAFIAKKFEEYSLNYASELLINLNTKGIIQDFKGNSAQPYLTLLSELELIADVNRVTIPSKWLKTYNTLNEVLTLEKTNVFLMNKLDKIFFLEILLKKDFLYLSIILEFLNTNNETPIKDLTEAFQGLLLVRLKELGRQEYYSNSKRLSQVTQIEKRVEAWSNAIKYLEHILMPRINWLADLEIIQINKNNIQLTENGKRLITSINHWTDITTEYIASSTDFLKRFYPHLYSETFKATIGEYPIAESIVAQIDKNIYDSFTYFNTLAPNRVTASQAITFSKYKIELENGYAVSEAFHVRILESKLNKNFIYKYQSRYSDGYIQQIINAKI